MLLQSYSLFLNTGLLLFVIGFLLFKSKSWTGPIIENRVGKIETNLNILIGNFKRLERDINLWKEEVVQTDQEILFELKETSTIGVELARLKQQFLELENKFVEIDQMTTSLPCNPCGGEKKK